MPSGDQAGRMAWSRMCTRLPGVRPDDVDRRHAPRPRHRQIDSVRAPRAPMVRKRGPGLPHPARTRATSRRPSSRPGSALHDDLQPPGSLLRPLAGSGTNRLNASDLPRGPQAGAESGQRDSSIRTVDRPLIGRPDPIDAGPARSFRRDHRRRRVRRRRIDGPAASPAQSSPLAGSLETV